MFFDFDTSTTDPDTGLPYVDDSGSECVVCPAGHYRDAQDNTTACIACDVGTSS